MKGTNYSIILPTFNESGNIKQLIQKLANILTKWKYEIIVVDDNSKDGTIGIVSELEKTNPSIKLFVRTTDKGLPKSILFGIKKSVGEYIICMDTDLSHPPATVKELIEKMHDNKFDMVVASRWKKGGGMVEDWFSIQVSKLTNLVARIILQGEFTDITSGFFIINKDVLFQLNIERIFNNSVYGEYFIRLYKEFNKKGFVMEEISFRHLKRKYGTSKTKYLKYGFIYLMSMIDDK